MIGQLHGVILEKHPPQLVLNVQGVGYEIDAPMSTFYKLPDIGQEVTLLTHFAVREDAQCLYGFYTRQEKALFRALLKVNGVGPKLALTILSSIDPDDFVRCISNNDSARLVAVPGVGKKTAERLVIEMRDKLSHWDTPIEKLPNVSRVDNPIQDRHQTVHDAVSALIALGYKPQEANRVVSKIDNGQLTSEQLIRQALREIAV